MLQEKKVRVNGQPSSIGSPFVLSSHRSPNGPDDFYLTACIPPTQEAMAKKARREIATLIERGKLETARIKVEGIIAEDVSAPQPSAHDRFPAK